MFRATWMDIAIWTTTALGVTFQNMATCGIPTKFRRTGLHTVTATGTGSARGAGHGLTIRPGALLRITMAAGIILVAGGAGAPDSMVPRFTDLLSWASSAAVSDSE